MGVLNIMELILGLFILAIYCLVYMAPTIVAVMREHKNVAPIAVITIFTAWTVIGWIACLAWSLSSNVKND